MEISVLFSLMAVALSLVAVAGGLTAVFASAYKKKRGTQEDHEE